MPYIRYTTKSNGEQYAALVNAVRNGKHVKQEYIENLGRVIDKQAGIFQNRKRGIFYYSVQDGFRDVSDSYITSSPMIRDREIPLKCI
jgi:hypothetical protein